MSNQQSREILFRGKSEDWLQERWVEGCLIHANDYCCILESEDHVHPMDYPYLDPGLGIFDGRATPVNPNTVGEYTGLTDRDGNRVFEGDILKYEKAHYVIEMSTDHGAWMINRICGKAGVFAYPYCSEMKIIGNIHDNPELLEVGHG